jgi:hypothetical protein
VWRCGYVLAFPCSQQRVAHTAQAACFCVQLSRLDLAFLHRVPCAPPPAPSKDGHIYVVETNPLLRPLLREAARACINPNMWWMESTWSRGMITNAASHRRLFLPAHQPNRR